jgi:hypothetical protein
VPGQLSHASGIPSLSGLKSIAAAGTNVAHAPTPSSSEGPAALSVGMLSHTSPIPSSRSGLGHGPSPFLDTDNRRSRLNAVRRVAIVTVHFLYRVTRVPTPSPSGV